MEIRFLYYWELKKTPNNHKPKKPCRSQRKQPVLKEFSFIQMKAIDRSLYWYQVLCDGWYKSEYEINLIVIDFVLQRIDNVQCDICLTEPFLLLLKVIPCFSTSYLFINMKTWTFQPCCFEQLIWFHRHGMIWPGPLYSFWEIKSSLNLLLLKFS